MKPAIERISTALRRARNVQGLSQRRLAEQVGMTQAQISRIEQALSDPRLSTVVELARALNLELVLVPRQLLPAVRALERQKAGDGDQALPLYRLEGDDD